MVSSTPWPHFTPGKDQAPILQETGWAPAPVWTGGKSLPQRDSIPDRPARSSVAIPTELHIGHYTLLNSCQNEKCFRQICREKQSISFMFYNFFTRKSFLLGLRTYTQNVWYVLLFYGDKDYADAPPCSICAHCLSCSRLIRDLSLAFAIFSSRSYYNISFRAYLCT